VWRDFRYSLVPYTSFVLLLRMLMLVTLVMLVMLAMLALETLIGVSGMDNSLKNDLTHY
jgi:hypothetical protein